MTGRGRADAVLVSALAAGATAGDAAGRARVSERTVYRRLQRPDFQLRLRAVRAAMIQQTSDALGSASVEAVERLRVLLKANSETVQLGAARAVLELGVRLREHVDMEERIRQLEERV